MFLAENFGTKLHIVHASTKQAVQMVRDAKARGLRFTARDPAALSAAESIPT